MFEVFSYRTKLFNILINFMLKFEAIVFYCPVRWIRVYKDKNEKSLNLNLERKRIKVETLK